MFPSPRQTSVGSDGEEACLTLLAPLLGSLSYSLLDPLPDTPLDQFVHTLPESVHHLCHGRESADWTGQANQSY